MITMLAADSAFDQVRLTSFAAEHRLRTDRVDRNPAQSNITNGGADDIHAGDLIMLTKGSTSTLVQVTRVDRPAGLLRRQRFAQPESERGAVTARWRSCAPFAPADTRAGRRRPCS